MIYLPGNKIAIQPRFDPDTSTGGIIIPDVAKERCDQGVVKYVGPKVKDIKPGDYVLFGGFDGTTVNIAGEGYLIILREPYIKAKFGPIATEINGLYFKMKFDEDALDKDIEDLYFNLLDARDNNKYRDSNRGPNPVKNLVTFKSQVVHMLATHYPYFPATYEQAVQVITDHFTSQPKLGETKPNIHDRELVLDDDNED